MKILNSIEIKNYKSIINEIITFDEMTVLVGANESGKSNILDALNHLSEANVYKDFEQKELNLSVQFQNNNQIGIKYSILLSDKVIPKLLSEIPSFNEKEIFISKKGNVLNQVEWELEMEKIPSTNSVISIEKKTQFRKLIKEIKDKEWINTVCDRKWFLSGGDLNMSKNPFYKMISEGIIKKLDGKEKNDFLKEAILDELLENIKVYFWKYDRSNYIKEAVVIDEFVNSLHSQKFKAVLEIFKIAKKEGAFQFKINQTNLRKFLIECDPYITTNLLNEIAKKFNNVFNRTWSTFWGKKVKLIINFENDRISFRFDDGRDCPPEYRSDGFKWFLTFMLHFQANEESLSDNIILMDEPGGNLHPRGQKDALNFLNKLNKSNQIIYTTHQTFLLDKNNPPYIRILDRTHKENDFWPTRIYEISKKDKHILTDPLLREALGFTLTDISPINELNLLVEGIFDRNFIYLINRKFNLLDLNFLSVLECGKASTIIHYARQFKESGLKVYCLYDYDTAGETSHNHNNSVSKNEKGFISDTKGETIEDLVPLSHLEFVFNEFIKKYEDKFGSTDSIEKPFMANTFLKYLNSDVERQEKLSLKDEFEKKLLNHISNNFEMSDYKKSKELLLKIKEKLK